MLAIFFSILIYSFQIIWFILSYIHNLLSKHLSSIYYVPDTVLDAKKSGPSLRYPPSMTANLKILLFPIIFLTLKIK